MTDNDTFTIGEAARILGVSQKALRHWDEIGLLTPQWRSWADYRLYTEADLERGASVVLYRSVGMRLADIQHILDADADADADAGSGSGNALVQALKAHRDYLAAKKEELDGQLASVDALINNVEQGDAVMDSMSKYLGENMPEYQKEAEERWGDTPEWEQSQARTRQMTDEDWRNVKKEQDDFAAELAAAKKAGVEPGGEAARVIVDKHKAMIAQWYDCTRARQLILARMYTHDQRFSAAYGGNAAYLLELVEAQAAAEGITEPSWND